MEPEKPLSTMYYGVLGVAAIGAFTLALLGIVMFSAPREQLVMTSIEQPLLSSTEQN